MKTQSITTSHQLPEDARVSCDVQLPEAIILGAQNRSRILTLSTRIIGIVLESVNHRVVTYASPGRPKAFTVDQALSVLGADVLRHTEWVRRCVETGAKKKTAIRRINDAVKAARAKKNSNGFYSALVETAA